MRGYADKGVVRLCVSAMRIVESFAGLLAELESRSDIPHSIAPTSFDDLQLLLNVVMSIRKLRIIFCGVVASSLSSLTY